MHVQGSKQLRVPADGHVFDVTDAIDDGLAGKLLHLDVVELPEVTEPLDELRGDATVELGVERDTCIRFCFYIAHDQGCTDPTVSLLIPILCPESADTGY